MAELWRLCDIWLLVIDAENGSGCRGSPDRGGIT